MDITIIKLSRGVKQADSHYRETGHRIDVFGKEEALDEDYYDQVKNYKCSECDFSSISGERVKRY